MEGLNTQTKVFPALGKKNFLSRRQNYNQIIRTLTFGAGVYIIFDVFLYLFITESFDLLLGIINNFCF